MAVVKYFILLFVLFNTFNVGYNFECYKCLSKVDEPCETKVVSCDPELTPLYSCISGRFTSLGEDYKVKDCENLFGKEHSTENYEFPNGLSHCGADLCNAKFNSFEFDDEGNLYTNNSYYLNYSLFVYVFAVVITIFTISF